jgi:magnesium chelatase family protein
MSLAVVYSRANIGIDAPLIRVEVHLSNGLPGFSIVGMPETAVKESKERVRSALLNTNLDFPDKKITVTLAPADLPKSGGRYDLAIATGILVASGQLPGEKLTGLELLGELA